MRQFRERIQFSIQFNRWLWSSDKTTNVEYGLIKALPMHIERTIKKFFLPTWVRNFFFTNWYANRSFILCQLVKKKFLKVRMFFTSLCNDSRNRQTFTSSSPTSTETEVLFFLLNRPKRILLFPCQLVKKTFLNVRMFFTSLCNDSKNKKHLPAQSQQQKHWKEL